jgi:hypothetical protein
MDEVNEMLPLPLPLPLPLSLSLSLPLSLLAVCVPGLEDQKRWIVDLHKAWSGREAICRMRMLEWDLVLAGERLPDMSVWQFVARVRAACSGQRWALVCTSPHSSPISAPDEVRARSMGALTVFDAVPDCAQLYEVARSLLRTKRRRAEAGQVARTIGQRESSRSPGALPALLGST